MVCGGVVSGLGKGTIVSSLGVLLRDAGLRVTAIKIDPYLNIDAGTMSPHEHGEVFVLNDGCEVRRGRRRRRHAPLVFPALSFCLPHAPIVLFVASRRPT